MTSQPEIAETDLLKFVRNPPPLTLYRMWFSKVKARWWTGHVQGIAAHHEPGDGDRPGDTTIFASVSDFPRGWGAGLINDNRPYADGRPVGMEAMAFPQGRHPGSITVCGDYLAVPIEMGDKPGRVYFYGLDNPLYPHQVGHVECWMDDHQGLRVPGDSKADNTKASAVGMISLSGGGFLAVVLSENRYLRFLHVTDTVEATGHKRLVGHQTGFVGGYRTPVSRWPEKRFIDNLSLIRTDNGIHIVLFSIDPLLMRGPLVVPRPWGGSAHGVTSFRLEPGTELDPTPRLEWAGEGWIDLPDRTGPTDLLRPGFRWGASMGIYGGRPGLITAEYFGNERNAQGTAQYLQFASNIDPALLRWEVGESDEIVRGVTGGWRRRLAPRRRVR